jgi:hypothetical protein
MSLALALALVTTPEAGQDFRAIADLTFPILVREPVYKIDPVTLSCVRHISLAWQIMDPREARYVCARIEDAPTDLKLLRRRYKECHDWPMVEEACIFPDRVCLTNLLSFNRAYRSYLDNRVMIELTLWWDLRTAIQRCDELYHNLDLVRDAKCEYYYVTVRRGALQKLVDKFGSLYLVPLEFVPLEYFERVP